MNQQITLHPSIIEYFSNNLPVYGEENNAQKIIKILRENYFTVDYRRDLYYQLHSSTKSIKDEKLRKTILDLLKYYFEDRPYSIENNFTLNNKLEFIIRLAAQSDDKILFNPSNKDIQLEKIRDLINYNVETHNISTFIKPATENRLKHNNYVLKLEQNKSYDIKIIFEPYFREATFVIVEDPYLPNKTAFFNFKSLIKFIPCKKLSIKIHKKENFCKHDKHGNKERQYQNFEEYAQSRNIELSYYESFGHHERFIITDMSKITLPGGLDFLDERGRIKSDNVEILIQPI